MKTRLYIGTYTEDILFGTGEILKGKGDGIYVFNVDQDRGTLTRGPVIGNVRNPSYLTISPDRRFLWTVNELKEFEGKPSGSVSAFRVDSENGNLSLLNTKPTFGTDPCHIVADDQGKNVFIANFMSGSICSYSIEADGGLGARKSFIQHEGGSGVVSERQMGPHAHAVVLDEEFHMAFVPDLGKDSTLAYGIDPDGGILTAKPGMDFISEPGAGPRHFALRPDGRFAYLVNELSSSLTVLSRSVSDGRLEPIQTVSTLPGGFNGQNSCADIQISPSGAFVYASNRGHDSISVFRTDPVHGFIERIGTISSGGRTPRSFAIDPSGGFMCIANQDSGNLVVFKIDSAEGLPGKILQECQVPTPVCVKYVTFP